MVKLYSNAVVLGYRRSKSTQQVGTNLLRIEGVKNRKDVDVCISISSLNASIDIDSLVLPRQTCCLHLQGQEVDQGHNWQASHLG